MKNNDERSEETKTPGTYYCACDDGADTLEIRNSENELLCTVENVRGYGKINKQLLLNASVFKHMLAYFVKYVRGLHPADKTVLRQCELAEMFLAKVPEKDDTYDLNRKN